MLQTVIRDVRGTGGENSLVMGNAIHKWAVGLKAMRTRNRAAESDVVVGVASRTLRDMWRSPENDSLTIFRFAPGFIMTKRTTPHICICRDVMLALLSSLLLFDLYSLILWDDCLRTLPVAHSRKRYTCIPTNIRQLLLKPAVKLRF